VHLLLARLLLRRLGARLLRLRHRAAAPQPVAAQQESWEGRDLPPISLTEVLARRLAARWLLPIEGDPIPWGAILIGPEGRLQAV